MRLYMSLEIVLVFSMNSGARSLAAFAVLANQDPKAFAAEEALERRFSRGSSTFGSLDALPRLGDCWSFEGDELADISLFEYEEVVVKLRGADDESIGICTRVKRKRTCGKEGLLTAWCRWDFSARC